MNLFQIEKNLAEIKAELAIQKSILDRETVELARLKARKALLEEAQQIIRSVAQQLQTQAHQKVAQVVSSCLRAVFNDPYEFKIHFDQKRGKTEARFTLERDGFEVDPLTASGGGVVDVAAFGLRLACLMLSKPRRRRLLILDEPFRMLSANYAQNAADMLEQMSAELGVQIIMVTHQDAYRIGNVVEIG